MKKPLLFLSMIFLSCAIMAQDTITGWTFPVNTGADSLNANLGTSQNQGYDLRFQWVTPNDTTVNTVFFTDGSTSYAAATTGWENGANEKYWSIKFKASGYSDFKLSSRQKSIYTGYNAGPGEFKIQWRLSGGEFADVPNGTVTVVNDWTTGQVTDLPVPITGQGTSSIYIRWISTTNNDFGGTPITPNGISMIDDIVLTGTSASGTRDILYTNRVLVYPTPNQGNFTVDSKVPVSSVEIYSVDGKLVYRNMDGGLKFDVNSGITAKGTYLLKIIFSDSEGSYSQKILID